MMSYNHYFNIYAKMNIIVLEVFVSFTSQSMLLDLQRGGVLIQKWGRSSAASTAVSIVDAIRSLITPTPPGDWFSSGVNLEPTHLH